MNSSMHFECYVNLLTRLLKEIYNVASLHSMFILECKYVDQSDTHTYKDENL